MTASELQFPRVLSPGQRDHTRESDYLNLMLQLEHTSLHSVGIIVHKITAVAIENYQRIVNHPTLGRIPM